MESPYTILELPKPLHAGTGLVHSANVLGFHGSRKRKRHELAVGIDGESVNVYNIQKQSLQSTYPIPPQTAFCCKPKSCYRSDLHQRDTFAVLKEGAKRRLLRFTEKNEKGFTAPVKTELQLPPGDIVAVDVLPSESLINGSPQAVVTYTSETICIAEDLSTVIWREPHNDTEQIFLKSLTAAKKGILKSREDLTASIPEDATVLACHVGSGSVKLSTVTRTGLQHLDTIMLPMSTASKSCWQFSPDAGHLYQLNEGTLHIYDLSGTTPRVLLTIKEKGLHVTSFTILSDSLVLVATRQKVIIYDTRYGSVQASGPLSMEGSRKRKRDESVDNPPITLHWFKNLSIAVAASTELLGIPCQLPKSRIRLSSVIGKSASDEQATTLPATEEHRYNRKREAWGLKLNSALGAGDRVKLEEMVADEFNIENTPVWDLQNGFDLSSNQKIRALDLIQKLFTTDLKLRESSFNIVRWLFSSDLLTASTLSKLFGRTITSANIAEALFGADGTFKLIQDVLLLGVHLPLQFSVECLRLLIRSLDTDMPNGTSQDADLEAVAEAELSNVMALLENGLEVRSSTMLLIFGRLHAFPKALLTKSLRRGLQHRDLVFFIHLLRVELADAGWTQPYVESEDPMQDDSPSDRAIKTIGDLLMAAIDAIGPAGWLVGSDDDDLLQALQAEVEASLSGVYEAQALQAYFDEFERYVISLDDHKSESISMPLGGRSSIRQTQSGTPAHFAKARAKDGVVGLYQFERIRV